MTCDEVTINGKVFVPKETKVKGLPYVIVRTARAGVFAGYLVENVGQETVLKDARRLWYWDGAASLSQLSQEGVTQPAKCKFPCEVPEQRLFETIEILNTTEKARKNIVEVPVWKM